eukprot:20738-Eustigmatos_ZCMA.PRE.1
MHRTERHKEGNGSVERGKGERHRKKGKNRRERETARERESECVTVVRLQAEVSSHNDELLKYTQLEEQTEEQTIVPT